MNGVELTRRANSKQVFAMTAPLITTSDGKKMGKSEGGAVWLNADMLPPYDYWQFWRNTQDADVVRFLKLFTELPMEKIEELSKLEGAAINDAKKVRLLLPLPPLPLPASHSPSASRDFSLHLAALLLSYSLHPSFLTLLQILADECTRMLHGEEVLPSIHETASALFAGQRLVSLLLVFFLLLLLPLLWLLICWAGKSGNLDDLPKVSISKEDVDKVRNCRGGAGERDDERGRKE